MVAEHTALPASGTEEGAASEAREGSGSAVVRVLSYNIRSMRDDRAALARVIRACAPDLVLIQEAPRFFRWRKAAERLARSAGLVHVTGGATTAGPMILSTLRAHVERTEDILLPRTPGLHQRGFATAVVRIGRARLGVLSCHLSLADRERYEQAGLLLEQVAALGVPHTVAGGDLNDRPEGRSFRRVAAALTDAWTARPWGGEFTSTPRAPHQRIDAVFVSDGVEVLGCGVPHGLPGVRADDLLAASDHLPVLAALRVPAVG
ncbi:endonuclease/exonuclease/phosphatase family protein [Streptomyces sp. NPDC002446]